MANYCKRTFARETVSEAFRWDFRWPDCADKLELSRFPVESVTSVTADGTVIGPSAYELSPSDGLLYPLDSLGTRTFWLFTKSVVVVYIGGRTLPSTVLQDVENAVIAMVRDMRFDAARDSDLIEEEVPGVMRKKWWASVKPRAHCRSISQACSIRISITGARDQADMPIIQIRHSTVAGNVPVSLAQGEIGINEADGLLFYRGTTGAVTSFNLAGGGGAPINSPTFTGDPQAPTPATADNDTSIATTAFVKAQGYAPLASPTFTGNPAAPTPTAGDNDTSIATTAFVTTSIAGKADTSALAAKADLASPTFTGDPKAPTPAAGDNEYRDEDSREECAIQHDRAGRLLFVSISDCV